MTYEIMVMITSRRIIVYRADELLDNDIFLLMVKNAVLCGYYTLIFLWFDVEVWFLTYETTTRMMFKLEMDQMMTTYLGISTFYSWGEFIKNESAETRNYQFCAWHIHGLCSRKRDQRPVLMTWYFMCRGCANGNTDGVSKHMCVCVWLKCISFHLHNACYSGSRDWIKSPI